MTKKLPFYKMYPADFDTDETARGLDDREAGFFLRCLNCAWENGGSLPQSVHDLARIMHRKPSYVKRLWVRVGKCFVPHPEDSSRIVNPRQWRELCASQGALKTLSDSGIKGAKKRWYTDGQANGHPIPRACARSGSVSESVVTTEEEQTIERAREDYADEPRPTVCDFEQRSEKLHASWKRPLSPLTSVQRKLSELLDRGEDLTVLEAGIAAWVAYNAAVGWRFSRDRLVDALENGAWKIKPPPANGSSGGMPAESRNRQAMRILYERESAKGGLGVDSDSGGASSGSTGDVAVLPVRSGNEIRNRAADREIVRNRPAG